MRSKASAQLCFCSLSGVFPLKSLNKIAKCIHSPGKSEDISFYRKPLLVFELSAQLVFFFYFHVFLFSNGKLFNLC